MRYLMPLILLVFGVGFINAQVERVSAPPNIVMISDYVQYTEKVGVLEMGVHYEAHEVVKAKAYKKVMKVVLPILLGLLVLVISWKMVMRRRKVF